MHKKLVHNLGPKSYKLTEERALNLVDDNEFPGFAYLQVALYSKAPYPLDRNKYNKQPKMKKFQLRVYLFRAKNIPPADEIGASDVQVLINCSGKTETSSTKEVTLNPMWYETLVLDVEHYDIESDDGFPFGFAAIIYDIDKDLLGNEEK